MDGATERYPESLRDKLPRDESYPLTRSEVDAALLAQDVERIDLIYFLHGGGWSGDAGDVVVVNFRPVGRYSETLDLRVYSVPTRLKSAVALALSSGALEGIARWVAAVGRSEAPWLSMDHAVRLRWELRALHREEFEGSQAQHIY